MSVRWRTTLAVGALSLGWSGCFTARKPFAYPPTPQLAAKPLPQPRFDPPPSIETTMPTIDIPAVTLEAQREAEPPAPPPPPPRRARVPATGQGGTTAPTLTPPDIETVAPAPNPAPPQLTELLTEDRRKQYEADFAKSVAGAKGALDRVEGKRGLTPRQRQTVLRIKTFLQQAEESKVKDLATAYELARRADLLGQDLLKSLH